MAEASKKDQFKFLIREFHSQLLPEAYARDLEVPLDSRKIVTVYGPRRCGKSYFFYTLIQKLMRDGISPERILYLNFEDDRILPLKANELNQLLEGYFELYPENKGRETFLFFDEIQNISGWEVFVRRIHDKEKVKIWITGSSSKLLAREIATSLRGRTISFALYPLSFQEFLRFKGIKLEKHFEYGPQRFKIKKALEDYLEYGGFPEVVLETNPVVRSKILEEYFESLVFRDLAERHRIENMELLKDLLKYLFTHHVSLFSVNSYFKATKQSLRVSRQTILDYLKLIQNTGYFALIPKFSWSLKEQKANPQKIVCLDLGMRNRMAFRFTQDEGKAAENLVGVTLKKTHERLFYGRGRREVDFVVHEPRGLRAINVTYGTAIDERELEGLLEFKGRYQGVKELLLITKDVEEKRGLVKLIPLWKWLLTQ